jgi:ArsR family transcriptional regulator
LGRRASLGMVSRKLTAEQRAKVFKALSDPRRVEIVDALAKDGSLCGTQLAEQLGVSLALLCHHWDVLAEAGLIRKQRMGQLRVCTLDVERLREATFVPWTAGATGGSAMIAEEDAPEPDERERDEPKPRTKRPRARKKKSA